MPEITEKNRGDYFSVSLKVDPFKPFLLGYVDSTFTYNSELVLIEPLEDKIVGAFLVILQHSEMKTKIQVVSAKYLGDASEK